MLGNKIVSCHYLAAGNGLGAFESDLKCFIEPGSREMKAGFLRRFKTFGGFKTKIEAHYPEKGKLIANNIFSEICLWGANELSGFKTMYESEMRMNCSEIIEDFNGEQRVDPEILEQNLKFAEEAEAYSSFPVALWQWYCARLDAIFVFETDSIGKSSPSEGKGTQFSRTTNSPKARQKSSGKEPAPSQQISIDIKGFTDVVDPEGEGDCSGFAGCCSAIGNAISFCFKAILSIFYGIFFCCKLISQIACFLCLLDDD